jgi:hypothetical protein
MFIDETIYLKSALQRSAMLPAMLRQSASGFAPLEREGIFRGHVFYKHYGPTGRGKLPPIESSGPMLSELAHEPDEPVN